MTDATVPREVGSPSGASTGAGWRQDARATSAHLGSALLGGIVGGFVIGGIGGRVAMLVLRLTSDPSVVGLVSDDGFEIGRVSGDTFFLLLFASALGAGVGVLYLLTRAWIAPRFRSPTFGALGALVGGSGILHAEGIDFRLLEPVWLAVVMFIAIPAAGAAMIAAVVERLLQRRGTGVGQGPLALFLPLLALAALGPLGLALVVLLPLGIAVNQKIPLVRMWRSRAAVWIGRTLLTLWATAGAVALINDLRGIFAF